MRIKRGGLIHADHAGDSLGSVTIANPHGLDISSDGYAFTIGRTDDVFHIIDFLSDPTNPTVTGSIDLTGSLVSAVEELTYNATNDMCYVTENDSHTHSIDVSNRTSPAYGTVNTTNNQTAHATNTDTLFSIRRIDDRITSMDIDPSSSISTISSLLDATNLNAGHAIKFISSTIVAVKMVGATNGGVAFVDISNPSSMSIVGSGYLDLGAGYTGFGDLLSIPEADRLIVCSSIFSGPRISVIDVSTPSSPSITEQITSSPASVGFSGRLTYLGNKLYVKCRSNTTLVYDITDVDNPVYLRAITGVGGDTNPPGIGNIRTFQQGSLKLLIMASANNNLVNVLYA